MSEFTLRKAQKSKSKLRIGLSGTSGLGKTYSALLLAYGLVGDWSKVVIIDTENGSADLYDKLSDYNVITLKALSPPSATSKPYRNAKTPTCRPSSLTPHLTSGKAKAAVWRLTSRSPREIQREGFEYELTVNFNIERDNHLATASKDRTGIFINADPFVVTEATGKQLRDWADKGAVPTITPTTPATLEQKDRLREFMDKGLLGAQYADRINDATYLKTEELLKRLDEQEAQQQAEFAAHAEAKAAEEAKKVEDAAKEEAPKTKGKAALSDLPG